MADDEERDPDRTWGAWYRLDGNPIHVWKAIDSMRECPRPLPPWVMDYLLDGAAEIMALLKEAEAGKKISDQAARVGKALGFGAGPGQGTAFQRAALIERDVDIFGRVMRALGGTSFLQDENRFVHEQKLDCAYDIVAADMGVHRSTIVKATGRCLRRWRVAVPERHQDYREALSSMARFLALELRELEAGMRLLAARSEPDGTDESEGA